MVVDFVPGPEIDGRAQPDRGDDVPDVGLTQ
jgi:hypothetical protein